MALSNILGLCLLFFMSSCPFMSPPNVYTLPSPPKALLRAALHTGSPNGHTNSKVIYSRRYPMNSGLASKITKQQWQLLCECEISCAIWHTPLDTGMQPVYAVDCASWTAYCFCCCCCFGDLGASHCPSLYRAGDPVCHALLYLSM